MLLLDTCTLLWLAADQARLSMRAKDLIRERADSLFISSITAFEIAVKSRRGALQLPLEPQEWVARALEHHGINELPVTSQIFVRSASLPLLRNDPCDRVIVATAQLEGLCILTPDALIRAYPNVSTDW
jgi:PIN domain nuclease of toxin-antitoxin system